MSQEWIYSPRLPRLAGGRRALRHRPPPDELAGHGPQRQPRLAPAGMTIAVGATAVLSSLTRRRAALSVDRAGSIIVVGFALGGGAGLYTARTVKMTAMPQLVSLFNAVGGGAAALIAIDDFLRVAGTPESPLVDARSSSSSTSSSAAVTFTRLADRLGQAPGPRITPSQADHDPGRPPRHGRRSRVVAVAGRGAHPGRRAARSTLDSTVRPRSSASSSSPALVFGVTMVLPIGGADMPVVISLLNSFTGTAVAMAGFVHRQPGADHRRRPRRRLGRAS